MISVVQKSPRQDVVTLLMQDLRPDQEIKAQLKHLNIKVGIVKRSVLIIDFKLDKFFIGLKMFLNLSIE